MSNQSLHITLQTAIGPMLWGTNYWIATELLPPQRPLLAASARALPAGALLLLLAARTVPPPGWRLRIATLATLNVGLFFVLLFIAAERLPGGVAAAAGAVGPLVVLVLGWPVLGLRPSRLALGTGALGVVGVAALVLGPAASLDVVGVAAALGCAASMATATVLGRRWGRPPLPLVSLTAWQLAFGGLLVAPFVLAFEGVPSVPTTRNLAGFALMGVFGTAVAYGLWIRGVTALPASSMQFLALLSPARGHGDRMGRPRAVPLGGPAGRRGARDRRGGRRSAAGSGASRAPEGRGRPAHRADPGVRSWLTRGDSRRHARLVALTRSISSHVTQKGETAHTRHVERGDLGRISAKRGHAYMTPLDNSQMLH